MKDTVTVRTLSEMKKAGRKIVTITAYDATFAALFDEAGVDVVLVGDSLGMVVQGHANTLPVTVEHMIYHSRIVSRGLKRAHLVTDLPFGSMLFSREKAVDCAVRMLQEGAAGSVKLEGCTPWIIDLVAHLTTHGIPVMGHVGLIPQSVNQLGGFRMQGKTESQREFVAQGARALANAGAYAVVLEAIPADLAQQITETVSIPTIGIGAGPHCDGQVLVGYDLLGLNETYCPRFVKKYSNLSAIIRDATGQYAEEVRVGIFPVVEPPKTVS